MAVARRISGKYVSMPRDADRDQIVDYLETVGFKKLLNNGIPLSSSDCFNRGYKRWYQCGTYEDKDPLTHWVEFGNDRYNYVVRTTQVGKYDRYIRGDVKGYYQKTFSTFEDLTEDARKEIGLL